jgi:hypothetical protein
VLFCTRRKKNHKSAPKARFSETNFERLFDLPSQTF